MVKISGAVGYTLLKNDKNKIILVLADIHSNLPYCENGINISQWFDKISDESQLVIEEVPRENVVLQELWPTSPHTQSLKNFIIDKKYSGRKESQKSKNIELLDIRPFLKPFSWEIFANGSDTDLTEINQITFSQYLLHLDWFFMLREYDNSMFPFLKKVHEKILKAIKNKKNKSDSTGIFSHFQQLSQTYQKFRIDHAKFDNLNLKDMVDNKNLEPLLKLNEINSFIIEWYAILHTFSTLKPSVIHTGLAHSDRIVNVLQQVYQFDIIDQNGINQMNDNLDIKKIKSCINLPNEIKHKDFIFKLTNTYDNFFIF